MFSELALFLADLCYITFDLNPDPDDPYEECIVRFFLTDDIRDQEVLKSNLINLMKECKGLLEKGTRTKICNPMSLMSLANTAGRFAGVIEEIFKIKVSNMFFEGMKDDIRIPQVVRDRAIKWLDSALKELGVV